MVDTKSQNKMRQNILDFLGNKCCKCGNPDLRVLQVDHVNGDGYKERRGATGSWRTRNAKYKFWKDVISGVRTDAQLLCSNCHIIKTIENGENGGRNKTIPPIDLNIPQ